MKRKKIIGYKVRIRGDLKIEEDMYMIVWETVIKLPITPYKYVESFVCLLYTSPSPRDSTSSRMPSSA